MKFWDRITGKNQMVALDGYTRLLATLQGNDYMKGLALAPNGAMNDRVLEGIYRKSGIAQKIVDLPIADAWANGRLWITADKRQQTPESILIEQFETEHKIHQTMIKAQTTAMVQGGCAVYISVNDGKDPSEPVDLSAIGRGNFNFLRILPRQAFDIKEIDNTISETAGQPTEFRLMMKTNSQRNLPITGMENIEVIHPTRLIILPGKPRINVDDNITPQTYWGDSIFESLLTPLNNYESAQSATQMLLKKARTSYIKQVGLGAALMEEDGVAEGKLALVMKALNKHEETYGTVFIDSTNDYVAGQYNFANLDKITTEFAIALAADAKIPFSILFGTVKFGSLGANNTSNDIKNYFKRIKDIQEDYIRPATAILDQIIPLSAIGQEATYVWNTLESKTEEEETKTYRLLSDAINRQVNMGIVSREEAREIARQRLARIGIELNEGEIEMPVEEGNPEGDTEAPDTGNQQEPEFGAGLDT